jgi:hypothetical protein
MSRVKEVINEIMQADGSTQADLSRSVETSPENISISLKNGNPSIKTLKKWLKPFKAELIIKYKNKTYKL